MLNQQESNIISTSELCVVKETPVHLSDEKLRAALSRGYGKAQQDMNEFRLHKYYGVFFINCRYIVFVINDFSI